MSPEGINIKWWQDLFLFIALRLEIVQLIAMLNRNYKIVNDCIA